MWSMWPLRKGRCIYRLLHFVATYGVRNTEYLQFGQDEVVRGDKLVAKYSWEDGDIPSFEFEPEYELCSQRQKILKPLYHMGFNGRCNNFDYIGQEILNGNVAKEDVRSFCERYTNSDSGLSLDTIVKYFEEMALTSG